MTLAFGDLTQEELDRAYDQNHWAANEAEVEARIIARSQEIARRMPPQVRRYGPAEPQMIDIFAPRDAQDAPVFILIHGGAWRLSMREAFYGPAPAITAAGCILVVAGFQCLPMISMVRMAKQIRQSVTYIAAEIGAFGGNARNLHIVGHSSGAHLAAVMLTATGTPPLGSGTLISGLYDLKPVMLSSRRHYIELSADEVTALSPIRHLSGFTGSASIWWGSHDSPEFQRQSQAFANELHGAGRLERSTMLAGRNHFEMLEELSDPDGPILAAMLANAG